MGTNHQRAIYRLFEEKTIAYNAGLAKALGSVKAAVFIAQLLFWDGKGWIEGWVYKTINEVYEETGLSRREQETAIRACKTACVLKVKLSGIPRRRHFQINKEKLIELIAKLRDNGKLACPKPPQRLARDRQNNTNNTQKSTKEYGSNNKFLENAKKQLIAKMSVSPSLRTSAQEEASARDGLLSKRSRKYG